MTRTRPAPDAPEAAHPALAALWMTGAILSFSLMAVAGRAIGGALDTFEIMLYRSIIGIGLVLGAGYATGRLGEITRRRLGLHLARNVSHFTGQNLWFWALPLIPLAQLFALEFTSPLWVTLLAPLFVGERLTRARLLTALIGFAGILIVARPGASTLSPGVIAAAASAIGFAGSILLTKRLTRTETTLCILFWLAVMQTGLGLIMAGHDGAIAPPDAATLPWLALIGLAGMVAHLCLTSALSIAPASIVAPLDFLRLPVIALVGMAFYGEPLDPFVLIGAAVIFGANYANIRRESKFVTQA